MKKFGIFMVIAAAAGMASCTAQAPKADLKSEMDSLSYALGMAHTDGLKPYLVNRVGMDTTYIDDFIKGLNEGARAGGDKKQMAYYAGIQIGQQIANQMIPRSDFEITGADSIHVIDFNNYMAGFVAGALEKGGLMTTLNAQTYANTHMEAIKEKKLEETFADNKLAGEKFLEENKKKEGVITTPSGLQYEVLVAGTGIIPADSCKVKVNYTGTLIDGTKFDSSYDRKTKDGKPQPATFRVKQVIKGWTEALTMMPVGSKWKIYVPQELAYGSRDTGKIKPFSALIFEIELVGIEEKKPKK